MWSKRVNICGHAVMITVALLLTVGLGIVIIWGLMKVAEGVIGKM